MDRRNTDRFTFVRNYVNFPLNIRIFKVKTQLIFSNPVFEQDNRYSFFADETLPSVDTCVMSSEDEDWEEEEDWEDDEEEDDEWDDDEDEWDDDEDDDDWDEDDDDWEEVDDDFDDEDDDDFDDDWDDEDE